MERTQKLTKLAVRIALVAYLLQAAAGIAVGSYVAYNVTQKTENLSQAFTQIKEALRVK